MLISLSAVWRWRSFVWLRLFLFFLLCCVFPIAWSFCLSDCLIMCLFVFLIAVFLSALISITHFFIVNHVTCAVYMIVSWRVLLFVLQLYRYFHMAFSFCDCYILLQSREYSITLPVAVFRYYVTVSLLLLTVVLFNVMGQRVRVPLSVVFSSVLSCAIL